MLTISCDQHLLKKIFYFFIIFIDQIGVLRIGRHDDEILNSNLLQRRHLISKGGMMQPLHLIMALVSWSILFTYQGCESDRFKNEPQNNKSSADESENSSNQAPNPSAILEPPPPPPAPLIVPNDGNGGGSQGGSKPARTGNKDIREPNPDGVCGNGVQEVLQENSLCPFDIYGSTSAGEDFASNLVGFNISDNGVGTVIDAIGPNIERVSAIDFSPSGVLYGAGEIAQTGVSVFFTIDCQTAQVSIIGETGIESLLGSDEVITDIDFDSFGRLWAYVANDTSEFFGSINENTGLFQLVANSGAFDIGNGIGSSPFPVDILYHASGQDLNIINRQTGISTFFMPLIFSPPANTNPNINAIDNDPASNLVYVSLSDGVGTENYLAILNINSGVVSFLDLAPEEAPDGLDGIAVNRLYEECDPLANIPTLPVGTICNEECLLLENVCTDEIDNDADGLLDCEDPDCLNQPCNDTDGCTVNDICVDLIEPDCVGMAVNCEIIVENECSVDICLEISDAPGNENFKCNSSLDFTKTDFGSCTPNDPENCQGERNEDGSCPDSQIIESCLVGRCIQITEAEIPVFTCESGDKEFIPIDDGGCEDGNSCTADDCEEDQGGICDYDSLSNIPCDDNNLCTDGIGTCNLGQCEGELALDGCTTDDDCPSGSCFQPVGLCTCPGANDNPCTQDLCGVASQLGDCVETLLPNACSQNVDCGPGGFCVDNVCICEDGFACTQDQTCENGICITATFDDEDCQPNENICTMRSCTINGCETTLMDGLSSCTVIVEGLECDGLILCINGDPQDNECIPNEPLEQCSPLN